MQSTFWHCFVSPTKASRLVYILPSIERFQKVYQDVGTVMPKAFKQDIDSLILLPMLITVHVYNSFISATSLHGPARGHEHMGYRRQQRSVQLREHLRQITLSL